MDVLKIRKSLDMSQSDFANLFGLNYRTLQDWEQGRANPKGAVISFLTVLEKNPMFVIQALKPDVLDVDFDLEEYMESQHEEAVKHRIDLARVSNEIEGFKATKESKAFIEALPVGVSDEEFIARFKEYKNLP